MAARELTAPLKCEFHSECRRFVLCKAAVCYIMYSEHITLRRETKYLGNAAERWRTSQYQGKKSFFQSAEAPVTCCGCTHGHYTHIRCSVLTWLLRLSKLSSQNG